jgi:hypothetical protein
MIVTNMIESGSKIKKNLPNSIKYVKVFDQKSDRNSK